MESEFRKYGLYQRKSLLEIIAGKLTMPFILNIMTHPNYVHDRNILGKIKLIYEKSLISQQKKKKIIIINKIVIFFYSLSTMTKLLSCHINECNSFLTYEERILRVNYYFLYTGTNIADELINICKFHILHKLILYITIKHFG